MNKVFVQFYTVAILLLVSSIGFAKATAHVNQTTVYEGDPVTFTIEVDTNSAKPDLKPLSKDFNIVGTSTGSQINIFNNQRSYKKTWTITLQPKRLGSFTIPSIAVGNDHTTPVKIKVTTLPPEIKAETKKHIFIETSIDSTDKDFFVQQQIPFTVKIFYDSSMISGNTSPLNVENAVVEQIIQGNKKRVTRNGKQFTVTEQVFVISPEKSGILTIPPISVKGRIALSGGDSPTLRRRMDETDMLNRFFSNFGSLGGNDPFNDPFFRGKGQAGAPSKPFSVSSEEKTINILPVPSAFKGSAWLPSEELIIEDSWSKKPPELKVGEPVLRTLVLQAKGLAASQIPDIALPKANAMKTYVNPAKAYSNTDGETIYGIQEINITYIPKKSGKVIFPKIQVDWWNTASKKQENFILPEWSLNVEKGTDGEKATEEVEAPSTKVEAAAESNISTQSKNSVETKTSEQTKEKLLGTQLLLLLTLGLLILTLFIYWLIKRFKRKTPVKSQAPSINIKVLKSAVLNACNQNDPQKTEMQLLAFIQALWNDASIISLGSLVQRMEHELDIKIIKNLELSLYAPDAQQWSGKDLYALIKNGIQPKKTSIKTNSSALKPLYPD